MFKDRAQGKRYFSVKNFDGNISITIKDNGIGVEPASFAASCSFGNKMIQPFVQKMKANLQVRNDNGTEILPSYSGLENTVKEHSLIELFTFSGDVCKILLV